MRRGFTLTELLVVISTTVLLMGILLPVIGRARLQAKITVVNAELRQIGIALESYYLDHEEYPPTLADCWMGSIAYHLYQLPRQLPTTSRDNAMSTVMEDRFHPGYTYKYRGVGEVIRDRDRIDQWIKARLWVPDGFPERSSIIEEQGDWFDDPQKSPVTWVIFSLGPNFDGQRVDEKLADRYPVPEQTWYSPKQRSGFIVRMRLKKGRHIGSFEK
jgi:competence protein ComGC